MVVKEEDCMFLLARRFYGLSLLHIVVPSVACVHQRRGLGGGGMFIVGGGRWWSVVGRGPSLVNNIFLNGEWRGEW